MYGKLLDKAVTECRKHFTGLTSTERAMLVAEMAFMAHMDVQTDGSDSGALVIYTNLKHNAQREFELVEPE